MTDTIEETEEQMSARLLDARARAALRAAPDLIQHVRTQVFEPGSEQGIEMKIQHTPLRTGIVDDADLIYAQLIRWVMYWVQQLEVPAPSITRVAWATTDDVKGFRAGTTPKGASGLTRDITTWLLLHADAIATNLDGHAFQQDVGDLIWATNAKYPRKPGKDRPVLARPCPNCGEHAVQAQWFGEPLEAAVKRGDDILTAVDALAVRCTVCGEEIEMKSAAQVTRWLS